VAPHRALVAPGTAAAIPPAGSHARQTGVTYVGEWGVGLSTCAGVGAGGAGGRTGRVGVEARKCLLR